MGTAAQLIKRGLKRVVFSPPLCHDNGADDDYEEQAAVDNSEFYF